MTYSSIATFLHDVNTSTETLDFAIQAAAAWGAHLHIICAGVASSDPGYYYAGVHEIAVQQNLEHAQEKASRIETMVRGRLKAEDIKWDLQNVTLMADSLVNVMTDHLRYCELAILPLPYSETSMPLDVNVFETCLFGAELPVLVVPKGAKWTARPANLLLAWDNGKEALSAARAALPLAVDAERTEICVIDPPVSGSDRSDPGGRLAEMLARAGAKVEIAVMARLQNDVADQLLQRSTEIGADLVVMGAYGHSRLREAVIGGVTRSMLRKATVPVLMAR